MTMNQQTTLIILAFASVAALVYFVSTLLFKGDDGDRLRSRLQGKTKENNVDKKARGGVTPLIQQIGQAASKPFMPNSREKQSALKKNLGMAGIYSPSAIRAVQGLKVICLSFGLIGGYVAGLCMDNLLMFLPVGGLIGYLTPTIWLRLKVRGNQ